MDSRPMDPIPPAYQPEPQPQVIKADSERRFQLLNKLVRFSLLINIIFGAIIIFVSIFILAYSFDLLPGKDERKIDLNSTNQSREEFEVKIADVKVSEIDSFPPIYINEQSIDIEKAFKGEPSKGKVTVYGKLEKEVLGFLPYWAVSKLNEINTKVLTSISYFGLEVDRNGEIIKTDSSGKPLDPWVKFQSDVSLNAFIRNARKNKIKVYLTLKSFNQSNIINLVTKEDSRKNFIRNALYLMNSKSLDGINLDFEYIGTPDDKVRDGFSHLVIELNKELKREYPDARLTIDTFVDAAANKRIHDIPVLAENSDGLVIMGYDFHTPNSAAAGPVAPMEGSGLSLVGLMSSYLEKAPAEKLILAVPYYGYDWSVEKSEKASKVVGGRADVKIVSYGELIESTKKTQINWDENSQTPWYSYTDPRTSTKRVVHFENARSLGTKYDFVNSKNLQGVGIWALGFDGRKKELNQLLADKFAN